ncbi:MAG: PhoH family protein [bacterium]
MGKRANRKSSKRSIKATAADFDRYADNVEPLFHEQGWSPMETSSKPHSSKAPFAKATTPKYRKNLLPRNDAQASFIAALDENPMVIASGPAGTGKTYVAVAKAVQALEAGEVNRIILSRPAVDAGESLGYLPGGMEDKLSPYLRPLYDALADRLSGKKLKSLMAENIIEIAPIAFMRGRTLNNAYVVIDEAQNCTYGQLKMLLTRLGWHSTMVITGDPDQSDLLPGVSGLQEITDKLDLLQDVSVIKFSDRDVVRHPLVAEMINVI